jgi:hypothetical protein
MAAGTALLFTILLNAPHIWLALKGQLTILDLLNHGTDEAYYFSLVRAASSHPFSFSAATQAALLQGWLLSLTGWSFTTVIFLGDLLYPALTVFFLALAAMKALRSEKLGAMTALLMASTVGTYFLRTANPQLPYVLVAAYFAAFFSADAKRRTWIVRGVLIGLLAYVQILYASLLILVEAVDLLRRLFLGSEKHKAVWSSVSLLVISAGAFLVPRLLAVLLLPSDAASLDTYHRLGIIPSHYPAAPFIQIELIGALILLLVLRKRSGELKHALDLMLTFIVALLIGLNQSILHGIDATFSSYYVNVLLLLQWGILPLLLIILIGRSRLAAGLIVILTVIGLCTMTNQVFTEVTPVEPETALMDKLAQMPPHVVAAPVQIANLLPVLTEHEPLFATFSFNRRAEDREIAERYLLEQSLFPSQDIDNTYPSVFGGYPGMLGARERTACRIWNRVLQKSSPCEVDVRSLVVHQELLPVLDAAKVDVKALLAKYHVGILVTDRALPAGARKMCKQSHKVGTYAIYRCG